MTILAAKDPQAVLDYSVDWTRDLTPTEIITGSSWTVSPPTMVVQATELNGDITTVWLSGGVAGTRYRVTNTIQTTERSFGATKTVYINCQNR